MVSNRKLYELNEIFELNPLKFNYTFLLHFRYLIADQVQKIVISHTSITNRCIYNV